MNPLKTGALLSSILLVCSACAITSSPGATTTSTTTTTISGCYIGAFVNGLENTSAFENLMGKNLAVNMWYITWNYSFPSSECDSAKNYGGVPMITWEPSLSTTNTLEAISNGNYDSYLTTFAQAAKNWGGLIYLRFAHEMNGNWYVWDGYHNGESSGPAKYIAAWKHIHNIFSSASATNVKWVWSPNHTSAPDESWNQAVNYYPGDDYVDWIGIDGYNWGQGDWQTFTQIFSSAYATFESYGKPLMISEFACATDESYSKADWITDAFSEIESTYSRIRIFVWFNQNKERDWRVSSSTSASDSFKNAVDDSYFLEIKPGN